MQKSKVQIKNQNFYSHLIEYESIYMELDELDMTEQQRHHLAELIDANLHNTILEAILSEMSDEDKVKFIKHLSQEDHGKIWEHLNEKVDNIEEKIKKAAVDLKMQLHEDIKEAKKKS